MDFVKNLGLRLGNLAARIPKFPEIPAITLRGNALKVTAYLLYALVLGVMLLLWKFPYSSLEQRLEAAASRDLQMRVELSDLSPSFPLGLKASRCVVRPWEAGREPVLEITDGVFRLRILSLLRGTVAVIFRGRASGGSLSGDWSFGSAQDRPYRLEAVLQSLRLEEHRGIAQLLGREVGGLFSGEFQLAGSRDSKMNSTGGGKIQLRQGSWSVNSPYLKVKRLDGVEANATVKVGEGTLVIEGCDFKGTGIQGTLKGTVNLAAAWAESTLELAGEAQVDGTLLNLDPAVAARVQPLLQQSKPIPFHVRGTLHTPEFSIF